MRVTLLGTGMPQPDPARRGPSQIIDIDGSHVLVDCGAGTLYRLIEAGYDGSKIKRIAITHLHSDHVTGLADFLWAGWTQRWWNPPPPIVGPPGTAAMIEHLIEAYAYDRKIRQKEGALTDKGLIPEVIEIDDGWSFESDVWRLTGFRVEHHPVDEAFGFRVDSDKGSVVVSGDTRRAENLIKHSKDVDVLIHEVIWRTGMERLMVDEDERTTARWKRILDYHTPAEDVGDVAMKSGAKHVVLSHIIAPGGEPENLIADVRTNYDGQLTVGEDLATFETRTR